MGYTITLVFVIGFTFFMPQKLLAFHRHNHTHCVFSALAEAQELCNERGARLTPLRRQVLELIWQSHIPLGAYALMDQLAELTTRRVARSEEHTSELQSRGHLVCRLLPEKKIL